MARFFPPCGKNWKPQFLPWRRLFAVFRGGWHRAAVQAPGLARSGRHLCTPSTRILRVVPRNSRAKRRSLGQPPMVNTDHRVNIFEYLDYRAYLRDHYQERKAHEYGFSHRAFSKRAGLRSTNYLKLVMDGQRNLSPEMAHQFADGCGLEGRAADYFCELVAFNQADTAAERNRCHERMMRYKQYRAIHNLASAQSAYYATWYLPAIRELAARPDFDPDPKWIGRTLLPRIAASEAQKALATLLQLGLLVEDADGRIRQSVALVTSGPGPLGHQVVNYHRAMLERASAAIDLIPREEREISALTLCVSQEVLLDLKERIREFRRELLQLAELGGAPERVVQLNFQLFPLSEKTETDP